MSLIQRQGGRRGGKCIRSWEVLFALYNLILKYFTCWLAKVGLQTKETETPPYYYKKLVRDLLHKAQTLKMFDFML